MDSAEDRLEVHRRRRAERELRRRAEQREWESERAKRREELELRKQERQRRRKEVQESGGGDLPAEHSSDEDDGEDLGGLEYERTSGAAGGGTRTRRSVSEAPPVVAAAAAAASALSVTASPPQNGASASSVHAAQKEEGSGEAASSSSSAPTLTPPVHGSCACGCSTYTTHPARPLLCGACYHVHDVIEAAASLVLDPHQQVQVGTSSSTSPRVDSALARQKKRSQSVAPTPVHRSLKGTETVSPTNNNNSSSSPAAKRASTVEVASSGAASGVTASSGAASAVARTSGAEASSSPSQSAPVDVATKRRSDTRVAVLAKTAGSPSSQSTSTPHSDSMSRRKPLRTSSTGPFDETGAAEGSGRGDGDIVPSLQSHQRHSRGGSDFNLLRKPTSGSGPQRVLSADTQDGGNNVSSGTLEDELIALRLENGRLLRQNRKLRDETDAQRRSHETQISEIESEHRTRVAQLRQRLDSEIAEETAVAREEARAEQASRIKELNERIVHLEDKLEKTQDALAEAQDSRSRGASGAAAAGASQLKQDRDQAQKKLRKLRASYRETESFLQTRISELTEAAADAQRQVVDLESGHVALQEERDELLEERDELRDKLEQTEEQLALTKDQLSSLQETPARLNIVQELAETEAQFLANLRRVVEYFMEPIENSKEVSGLECPPKLTENFQLIFGNIRDVLESTVRIERAIARRMDTWNSHSTIGSVFLTLDAKIYESYMHTHVTAIDLVSNLQRKGKAIKTWLRAVTEAHPDCNRLDLLSFLIMPVQRILRYRMLLQDLLKHTEDTHPDFNELERAVALLEQVAEVANRHMREEAQRADAARIKGQLVASSALIESLGLDRQRFLREGAVMKVSRKSEDSRVLILFSTMLLVTSSSSRELDSGDIAGGLRKEKKAKYSFHHAFLLSRLRIKVMDTDTIHHGLQIISEDKSFIVYFKSAAARTAWVSAITQAKEECDDSVADSVSSEEAAPVWIPDSATKNCMTCNVTFTVIRRRHHCRYCGKVVCGNCTKDRIVLPRTTDNKKVRVCKVCFTDLSTRAEDESESVDIYETPRRSSRPSADHGSSGRQSKKQSRGSRKTTDGLRSWRGSVGKALDLEDLEGRYKREFLQKSPDSARSPNEKRRTRRSRTIGDASEAFDEPSVSKLIVYVEFPKGIVKGKFVSSLLCSKMVAKLEAKNGGPTGLDAMLLVDVEFNPKSKPSRSAPIGRLVQVKPELALEFYQEEYSLGDSLSMFYYPVSMVKEKSGSFLIPRSSAGDALRLPDLRSSSETSPALSPTSSQPRTRKSTGSGSSSSSRRSAASPKLSKEKLRKEPDRAYLREVRDAVAKKAVEKLRDLVDLSDTTFVDSMVLQAAESRRGVHRAVHAPILPLLDAVKNLDSPCVEHLIAYVNSHTHGSLDAEKVAVDWFNVTDSQGTHALHLCFEHQSGVADAEGIANLLLKSAGDPPKMSSAFANASGNTPLHYWAKYCDWSSWRDVGKLLLKCAIDVGGDLDANTAVSGVCNAANAAGDTALHCCMMNSSLSGKLQERSDMAGMLLEAGADPNLPNSDGFTPLHTLVLATATQLIRAEPSDAGKTARPWERSLTSNIGIVCPEEIVHIAALLIAAGADLAATDGSSEKLTPAGLAAQMIETMSATDSVMSLDTEVTVRSLHALQKCLTSVQEVKALIPTLAASVPSDLTLRLAKRVLPRCPDHETLASMRDHVAAFTLVGVNPDKDWAIAMLKKSRTWRSERVAMRLQEFGDDSAPLQPEVTLSENEEVYDLYDCGFIVPNRTVASTLAARARPNSLQGPATKVAFQEFVEVDTQTAEKIQTALSLFAHATLDPESCLVDIYGFEQDKSVGQELVTFRVLQEYCQRRGLREVLSNDSNKLSWDQLLAMAAQVTRALVSFHESAVRAAEAGLPDAVLLEDGIEGWDNTVTSAGVTSAVRNISKLWSRATVHGLISPDSFQVDANLQVRLEFAIPSPNAAGWDAALLREVSELDSKTDSTIWAHYAIPDDAIFKLPPRASAFSPPEGYFVDKHTGKNLALTPRADVYSVGVLLWVLVARAIAGRYVEPFPVEFDGHISESTMRKIAFGPLCPADIAGAPEPLINLIKDCTRRQPVKRPTMRMVQQELEAIHKAFILQPREWLEKHENSKKR